MINTTAFGKRIQEIMKYYHLSASGFADAMGVGRSSISHILSGRNKPSLDFIMKITDAYPEAELYWLLYGKGTFPKSEKEETVSEINQPILPTPIKNKLPESSVLEDQDLFSVPTPEPLSHISENKAPQNKDTAAIITSGHQKEVHQIVFFYKDGSFEVYKN